MAQGIATDISCKTPNRIPPAFIYEMADTSITHNKVFHVSFLDVLWTHAICVMKQDLSQNFSMHVLLLRVG